MKVRIKTQEPIDIYLVTQFALASANSTGYLWTLLMESAQRAGYSVHLIAPRTVLPDWVPKTLAKFINTVFLMTACLWRLPRRSTVLCATNPTFLPLALSVLRVIKRLRVFVLIHDLFPQNTLVAGLLRADSRRYRFLSYLYRASYKKAAGLIVIGRDMEQVLRAMLGPSASLLYVANWVCPETVITSISAPKEGCETYTPNVPPPCIFQYFGNLGALQGLDVVLDGIAKSQACNARFDFIGTGTAKAAIIAHPVLGQDPRVSLRPSVAFIDRAEVLRACDVSLVTLRPQMFGLAVPSKAYFSMAHGKPFLYVGDRGSELHLTLQDYPALGWFVPAGDAQALADQIDKLCAMQPCSDFASQASQLLTALHPDQAVRKIMNFITR